ncbi:PREDICTED: hemicentin-2-like [Branchiostoma belcheri]|uniref:Hemicentin-2-like n=1 Tax=Branchiostoma belcheri TaxID=7741 RepID=A0A6P4YPF5_BRABE|nr:PREDICTED: hemicentin-2-like [Branchiostoma belcheri]
MEAAATDVFPPCRYTHEAVSGRWAACRRTERQTRPVARMWRRASNRLRRLLLLYGIAWLRLQGVHGEMGNPVEAKGTQGDSITLPGAVNMDDVLFLTWSKVEGSGQIRIAVYMYKPKGAGEQSNSLGPLKGRAELTDRGSLRIKDLKLRDEGMYVLTALLEGVGTQERTVSLEVIVPPKLELNPRQDVYERRGKAVKLTCTVSHARPMVKYIRWEKDGGPVDQHHEATTYPGKDSYESVLSLRNLTKSDSGNYTCVTGHLERIVAASRHVEVHYPATIVNASDLVVAPVLTKVTLWCVADGNPPPNVTWYKLGWQNEPTATLEPSDSTRNNIIFNEIHRNDSGKYACSAANGIGKQDWRTISLVVRDSSHNSGR